MANFKSWVEMTRAGNFLVRHRITTGKKFTDYCIEKHESAWLNAPDTQEKKKYIGKSLANRYAQLVIDQYHQNKFGDVDLTLSLEKLVTEFLEDREMNNLSIMTINHDRITMTAFLRENDLINLSDITNEKIKLWKFKMKRRGMANETIRGRLADVRTFLNWLVENKRLQVSPFGKKMIPQKIDTEPKFYTASEFMALDKAISQVNEHARIACHIAHSAGLRKIEMVGDGVTDRGGVCFEDISWLANGAAELHLRKEIVKGRKNGRTVPLDPGLIELLGSRRTGPIVPLTRYQFDHYFQRARKIAGINTDLDIHGLRHTFAKNYLQKGEGNLASLKILMGHASIVTTQIYSQFEKSYFAEGINKAYERRLVDEHLAGQNVIEVAVAGQLQGKTSKTRAPIRAAMHGDAPIIK